MPIVDKSKFHRPEIIEIIKKPHKESNPILPVEEKLPRENPNEIE